MSEQTIALMGIVIGGLGLLFGVYTHFANRKVAKIVYEVSQISNFNVPASFLDDMHSAPVSVTLNSVGSKAAKKIVGEITFCSEINLVQTTPRDIELKVQGNWLSFEVSNLNPSQEVHFSLKVDGNPAEDQIESISITHEEGVASLPSSVGKLRYRFLGIEFEFDLLTNRFQVNQFGPWSR